MEGGAELFAMILAAPEDDTPRLVYADWLSERGDPLGEFIHVQLLLGDTMGAAGKRVPRREGPAALAAGMSHAELTERARALAKKHERTWVAPIRPFVRQWRFRRGFVDHVVADAARFLDGAHVLDETPLSSAQLTGFSPVLAPRFAEARAPQSLRALELSRSHLDATTIAVLGTPFFASIAAIDLWGNALGHDGFAALAKVALPSLRRLRLSTMNVQVDDLRALATAPFWSALTHLDLSMNRYLDDGAVATIASAPSLRWVNVSLTAIGQEGMTTLAAKNLLPSSPTDRPF